MNRVYGPPVTYREALARGVGRLRAAGIQGAELDAALLLAHAAGLTRAALYTRLPEPLADEIAAAYHALLERRVGGVPVAYLRGEREFMELSFAVSPAVLVPRPETELLVEWAIRWRASHANARTAVDVGAGSGVIAVSLAHAIPDLTVIAVDLSRDALRVAAGNAARHGVAARVRFVAGDLLAWLGRPVPLVLANLPYLTDTQSDAPDLRVEPRTALAGGDADGFALYRHLIPQVAACLPSPGAFAFEIDPAQADIARDTSAAAFPLARTEVHRDLAGRDRFITVEN